MILTRLNRCGAREVSRPLRSSPVGHIKIELLNHRQSPHPQSQNPDVWHLANITQDPLDWEQNECRERGSSFSKSTTGNKPIKKQETQHKPDLRGCLSLALCPILSEPQHTRIPTLLACFPSQSQAFCKIPLLFHAPSHLSESTSEGLLRAHGSGTVRHFHFIISLMPPFFPR